MRKLAGGCIKLLDEIPYRIWQICTHQRSACAMPNPSGNGVNANLCPYLLCEVSSHRAMAAIVGYAGDSCAPQSASHAGGSRTGRGQLS